VDAEEEEFTNTTQMHIDNYAREGLRTLVMARRLLSESDYRCWLNNFKQAELDLENRDRLKADSYNQLEQNLELIGATGIEDRLQDRVPETIEALRKAGIVVWVLTGDKRETAVSIAKSCKLFSPTMDIIPLYARNKDSTERLLNYYLDQVQKFKNEPVAEHGSGGDGHENSFNSKTHRGSGICAPLVSKDRALVVDGTTLTYVA
jgi:phospholipid-translocating ATPase